MNTGIGVQASGSENGNRTEYVNSRVNDKDNLTLTSQQDRASYYSKQSSIGFSASIYVPPICAGVPVQGSASMSGSKIYNDYASVQQQSGITAGDNGYNIFVGNHTQLGGAIIASSATPDKNHLSTGTLGWTDIENHANSGANGFSVAVSGSMGKPPRRRLTATSTTFRNPGSPSRRVATRCLWPRCSRQRTAQVRGLTAPSHLAPSRSAIQSE
ncbi:hemagglutinin repeat-containing protein [Pantoea sp. DY-17]|uniref:hemagglutinin repeat-containing protein n=1 Tax=Pantoea sp. DY-17 TaxID=2871490 RepID=UPI001C93F5E7|nr:hemagglutinin repeat-containing protein [Pantoea sp. DY-17]